MLAGTTITHSPAAPEVPTATGQGFTAYVFEDLVAAFGDTRQPDAARAMLVEATRAVVDKRALGGLFQQTLSEIRQLAEANMYPLVCRCHF